MSDWFRVPVIAVVLLAASYTLLVVLARRLPPGMLCDLVAFIPACLTTARALRQDPAVPRCAKVALVIVLAIRYAARAVPRDVLLQAWPEEPRLLLRLLGDRDPKPAS